MSNHPTPAGKGIHKEECAHFRKNDFVALKHQKRVFDRFVDDPAVRGLLLFHKLGSGKTCTSIMIADAILGISDMAAKFVYVLTPGSLRQNFVSEYCGVCGQNPRTLSKRYLFITYNTNVYKSLPPNFDDSVVIIDEVHNFINSLVNFSKNAIAIYERIQKSRRVKILALTGTPIYKKTYELAVLFNLLKPGTFPRILNFNQKEIDRAVIDKIFTKDGHLRDAERFRRRIKGLVSYVAGVDPAMYPEIVDELPVEVSMSPYQAKFYSAAVATESRIRRMGPPSRKKLRENPAQARRQRVLHVMAVQYIMSRSAANFVYPPDLRNDLTKKATGKPSAQLSFGAGSAGFGAPSALSGRIHSDVLEQKLESLVAKVSKGKVPDAIIAKGGWVDKRRFAENKLPHFSTKMMALLNNIGAHFAGKHVIFSFYKTKSGINLISAFLELCGVPTLLYTGDLSDRKRRKILARFNAPENRYGDQHKVLLLTYAGSEGITLLDVQNLHIFESAVREGRTSQMIGRVARYKSHVQLPPALRIIHIWRYWSRAEIAEDPSVDESLFLRGQKQQAVVDTVLHQVQAAAFEQPL